MPESFAEDDRLLRGGSAAFRVAVLREPAVSFGVGIRSGSAFLARAEEEGLRTVRRSTGGSGLLHLPGDLLWSVVLPRSDPRVGHDFLSAYARFGRGVVRFLEREGLASTWGPAPGLADDYCTLSGRGQVLSVGGRIVGGAAQHLTARALLHQGTLSVGLDRPAIDRLFGLRPPSPSPRLGSLRELGRNAPPGRLAVDLAAAIARDLGAGGSP